MCLTLVGPLRAHRQTVLAHGDRDVQCWAKLHAHRLDGFVKRSVFARLATSGHPVGRHLDAGQLDGRGQQIGDGLGHGHAARRCGVERGQRRALAHAHGFTGKALVIGQGHGDIGHGHLPRADHLVAVREATHGTVADGDEETLGSHRGVAQHVNDRLLQRHTCEIDRGRLAHHGGHIAVHLGRLAQQHVHGHVDRKLLSFVFQHQLALVGRNANHRKRATLALAKSGELRQRFGRNRHHIALLALVGPDFFGRQARLFELDSTQVKTCASARVVGQLGKSVGQTTRANIVDRQDGVVRALCPAVVDDLLRPALDLGIAALHRVKVQIRGVGAGGHGAGRTAAHANAHAGATQLDQQAARWEFDLLGLLGVDLPQTARDHDGLVVTPHHAVHGLFVFAEIAQQVGTAKLVVEGRATQRAFGHDLQGAGDVLGFSTLLVRHAAPKFGHGEARQTRLGLGAATGCALVADLAARARGCAGEWRNRGRVVVGFDLHQHMVQGLFALVSRALP